VGGVYAVTWLFGLDAVADELRQLFVSAAAAQDCAGIPFDGREEAIPHLAFGGDAKAVAVLAERLRDRVDKANRPAAIGEAEVGRRLAGVRSLGRLESSDRFFDKAADFFA